MKNGREKRKKKRNFLSWRSHSIRRVAEDHRKKGGFSGRAGRISTLPCHEVGVVTTLFIEEHRIGGPAPGDSRILKD